MSTELSFQDLRKLDDVSCANVVVSKNIRKLVKKYPQLTDTNIDCWVYGDHYSKFNLKDKKFIWLNNDSSVMLTPDEEDLDNKQLNKLLVTTYRSMCDSLNDDIEFIDSPEDILAYAEQKLKEMLADECSATNNQD